MTDMLDVYLNQYPYQNKNCLSQDSEFVTFVSHAIDLSVDLTVFPTIWAVLAIIFEMHDTNLLHMEVLYEYYDMLLCKEQRLHGVTGENSRETKIKYIKQYF